MTEAVQELTGGNVNTASPERERLFGALRGLGKNIGQFARRLNPIRQIPLSSREAQPEPEAVGEPVLSEALAAALADESLSDEQVGVGEEQLREGMRVQLAMFEQQLAEEGGLSDQYVPQIIALLEDPLGEVGWESLSSGLQQFLRDRLPEEQIKHLEEIRKGLGEEGAAEEGEEELPSWLLEAFKEEEGGLLERFGRKVDRLFTKETLKRIGIFLKDTFWPRRGKDFLVWLCGAAGGFLTTTAIDYALAPIVIPVVGGIIRGQVKKAATGGVMIVASRAIGSVLEKSYTRQAEQVRQDFLAKMVEAGGEEVQRLTEAQGVQLSELLEKMRTDKADVVQALAAGWATGAVAATVCSITGLTDSAIDRAKDWIGGGGHAAAVPHPGVVKPEAKLDAHDRGGANIPPGSTTPGSRTGGIPGHAAPPTEVVARATEVTGRAALPADLKVTIHVGPGESLWKAVSKAVTGKVPSEWAGAAGGNGPDVVLTDAIVDHLQKEGVTSGTINLARVLDDEKTIGWFSDFFKIAKSPTGTAASYWRALHAAHEALTATA